jgi:hypothetical protein
MLQALVYLIPDAPVDDVRAWCDLHPDLAVFHEAVFDVATFVSIWFYEEALLTQFRADFADHIDKVQTIEEIADDAFRRALG